MQEEKKNYRQQRESSSQGSWFALIETTPSGKSIFVCTVCGRTSPAPSACNKPPVLPDWHEYKGLTCEEVSAREREKFLHPILKNALQRSKVLAQDIRTSTVESVHLMIRNDRLKVLELVKKAIGDNDPTGDIHRALHSIKEELCKK